MVTESNLRQNKLDCELLMNPIAKFEGDLSQPSSKALKVICSRFQLCIEAGGRVIQIARKLFKLLVKKTKL